MKPNLEGLSCDTHLSRPFTKHPCSPLLCDSVVQNDIPVYSPALTDGSIGDMIYFHSFNNPGLIVDIAGGLCSTAESWRLAYESQKVVGWWKWWVGGLVEEVGW